MGVPRPALGWGACDPEQSEEPPPPLLAAGRARAARGGVTTRAGRHLAGPARAAARRRGRLARRRADHPRARRPYATASTTCGRCSSQAPPGRHVSRRADLADAARPLRLLLHDAARQRVSADRERAPDGRRRRRSPSTGKGGPIEALPFLQHHGDIPSLGFRFGGFGLFRRPQRLPDESAGGA